MNTGFNGHDYKRYTATFMRTDRKRDEHDNIRNILLCFIRTGDTLSEEQGIKVFENRALKTVFGSRWEDVKGNWKNYKAGSLKSLRSSANATRTSRVRTVIFGKIAALHTAL